jgi:hypothetical protein
LRGRGKRRCSNSSTAGGRRTVPAAQRWTVRRE